MPKQEAPPLFSQNIIVNGQFFAAGKETLYKSEAEVPKTLREFLIDPDSQVESNDPERANLAAGEVRTVGSILTRSGAQQASRLRALAEHHDWAEEQASEPLAPEIEKVLQEEHDLRVGKALAQAQHNAEAVDRAFENAVKEVDDRQQTMFVKRGNARHYIPAEGATLKPGETVFVRRRETNRYDAVGLVDATGALPPQEIL